MTYIVKIGLRVMVQRDPKNKERKKENEKRVTCQVFDHPRCHSATWICMCCYYQTYCVDSNQILRDRNHQLLTVSGSYTRQINPRWQMATILNKKLSYRRGTARCVVSVEILPIAMQHCRNSCTTSPEQIEVMKLKG